MAEFSNLSEPARTFPPLNDCPECDHPVIYHNEHGCFAAPDCDCTEQSARADGDFRGFDWWGRNRIPDGLRCQEPRLALTALGGVGTMTGPGVIKVSATKQVGIV